MKRPRSIGSIDARRFPSKPVRPALDVLENVDRFASAEADYAELLAGLKSQVENKSLQILRSNYQDED